MLGTFLLAYVVLNVATVKKVEGNSYYGLAIGMTVTSMACAMGPITGGAFNPAVGIMGLMLEGRLASFWIYWLACPLGGLLAAVCFWVQNPVEFQAADYTSIRAASTPPAGMTKEQCAALMENA